MLKSLWSLAGKLPPQPTACDVGASTTELPCCKVDAIKPAPGLSHAHRRYFKAETRGLDYEASLLCGAARANAAVELPSSYGWQQGMASWR